MSDKNVTIFEMGPRDGLQNEKVMIPTAQKIELINRLSETGLTKIEAASFVSPKWVPQMADGADVLAGIHRNSKITYSALTPNLKGYERAKAANADEIAIFASASEGFSQHNINCSIEESIQRFEPIMELAKQDGIPVRGYVSCIVECPYDGAVDPASVASTTARLIALGCYEVSLGDTIGRAKPDEITRMLEAVLTRVAADQLAGHYHDTSNLALDNIQASLDLGIRTFDSAVGGLGGCPYAPGAKGNVSTDAVVQLLHKLGYHTGIDTEKLASVSQYILSIKQQIQASQQ
ncbi:hydroxymethylglutaryl-CoA lyase [Leucothrix pacifica]|uniref:Hydroxymethylglutaryl-CoA lyase n=1 Tax=Leucothrix pacifica TaxID=1247513 RepID=A0A317CM20_9GAMM|nr:hydroxymethylglutaryl-CoA lyase [Leucothrix pacifica]PWQ99271.1 hydroxymethylglutaryl-CoA lyase [Leucothrix pacifica]